MQISKFHRYKFDTDSDISWQIKFCDMHTKTRENFLRTATLIETLRWPPLNNYPQY